MTSVSRFDASRLGKFKRTDAGAFVVPGHASRTGVQEYVDANGKRIREYRPPEEVFSPESLASFKIAPVTIQHPRGGVRADNFQVTAHGVALDARGPERVDSDPREWVAVDLALMSAAAIGGAESGKLTELSVGYTARIDHTPGVSPEGEPYDAIQRDIRVNHIALLPAGRARAGGNARLRLDGSEELVEDSPGDQMEEKLAEALGQVANLQASLTQEKNRADAAEAKVAAAEDRVKEAEAKTAEAAGRADALEAELKPLREDSARRETAEVAAKAAKALGKDYKADGKSAHDVRVDAIKATKAKLSDEQLKNEVYVQAYFDARFDAAEAPSKHDYNRKDEKETKEDQGEFDFSAAFLAKPFKESK